MDKRKSTEPSADVDTRQIDNEVLDVYQPEGLNYPVVERTNNALLWPEEIKGGIDFFDLYSVTQVPKSPNTPLE